MLGKRSLPSGPQALTLAYDAAKRPTSLTLTTGGSLSQAYDRAGNVISEDRSLTGPSGDNGSGAVAYTYDRLSRLTGESGLTPSKSYTYDQDGNRLTKVEGSTTFDYAYDRSDALVSVIKTGGSLQSFSYDAYGRQLTEVPPDNVTAKDLDTSAWVYEAGGRLDKTCAYPATGSCASTTDRRTSDFTYNALGRVKQTTLTQPDHPITTTITRTTTYGLDGQPLTVADGADTLTYVYDTLGRLDPVQARQHRPDRPRLQRRRHDRQPDRWHPRPRLRSPASLSVSGRTRGPARPGPFRSPGSYP
jgi:YD repeat-containing protein